jgi:hypothetical protein
VRDYLNLVLSSRLICVLLQSDECDVIMGETYDTQTPSLLSSNGVGSVHDAIQQYSNKEMRWTNSNYEHISRVCSYLCLSDAKAKILLNAMKHLDSSIALPSSVYELRKEENNAIESAEYYTYECPILPPHDNRGACMIAGDGKCELIMYDIISICQNLLNNEGHAGHIHWNYEPLFDQYQCQCFNELWTCGWWKDEEARLPCGKQGKIMAICLSSDETHVTMTGRKMYPIYIYLGNYARDFKNKGSGWALLGFQPMIGSRKGFSGRTAVRTYKRRVRRWAMEKLTEAIKVHENGVVLDVRGEDGSVDGILVYPRLAIYAGDEQEILRSVYGGMGGKCWKPCRLCHVSPRDHANNVHGLREFSELRSQQDITKFFNSITKTSSMTPEDSAMLSIHPEFNALFFVPGFSPLENPSCRMHQTDAGIYKNMIQDIICVLKEHGGQGCLSRFDSLWSELIPFKGWKSFKQGVTDTALLTAGECRCLSMCLPFVLRGIEEEFEVSERAGMEKGFLENVSIIYIAWRWLLGYDSHTDESLDVMTILGDDLQLQLENLRKAAKGDWTAVITEGPKFHNITHWSHWIRKYGCTGNYNTESFEKAHRMVIKKWVQKMALRGTYAERKVLFQQKLFDAHTMEEGHDRDDETHEERAIDGIGRNIRWGRGGFRGRINLPQWLGLDQRTVMKLRHLENDEQFTVMSVEDMKSAYELLLDKDVPFDQDIGMLLAILESAKGFLRHIEDTHSIPTSLIHHGVHVTAFSNRNPLNLTLWKKSYVQSSECYVQHGSVVRYCVNLFRQPEGNNAQLLFIGCVRWIFSIQKSQYMVIQRMNELPYRHGPKRNESILSRLKRIEMLSSKSSVDILRCFCQIFKLSNRDEIREHCSFDVIWLGGSDDISLEQDGVVTAYPISAGLCVQPDFRAIPQTVTEPSSAFERVNARFFLSEFVIV